MPRKPNRADFAAGLHCRPTEARENDLQQNRTNLSQQLQFTGWSIKLMVSLTMPLVVDI